MLAKSRVVEVWKDSAPNCCILAELPNSRRFAGWSSAKFIALALDKDECEPANRGALQAVLNCLFEDWPSALHHQR
jgi:hypothetical protein